MNYIIIICINNNNVLINNNYGRLQDIFVIFKIPMGTSKNFFKIYRQYGHVPIKSLPTLVSQGFDKFCIYMICSYIYIFSCLLNASVFPATGIYINHVGGIQNTSPITEYEINFYFTNINSSNNFFLSVKNLIVS